MSFLRAHAGLLDERYGLYIDPRVRHPQDWVLGLAPLETPMTGSSVGAAIVGTFSESYTCLGTQALSLVAWSTHHLIIAQAHSGFADSCLVLIGQAVTHAFSDPVCSSHGNLLHPSRSALASLRHGRGLHLRSVMRAMVSA
jgi:hypothetical protein